MKKLLWSALCSFLSLALNAQSFEASLSQETVKGIIGETIKVPVKFKNTSEKAVTIIVKRISSQIGTTQKNFYCLDNNCLDSKVEDFVVKVEPGHTLATLQLALEAGLVPAESLVKYVAYNKANPTELVELNINFIVDEKSERANIYTSRYITLQDVYPNPSTEYAYIDYKISNDKTKARVLIHNILGNKVSEYNLPALESKIKISTLDLNPGIYFYTLYINNEGVMTRKLIVKN